MMDGWEEVRGLGGTGHVMDTGERLLNFCSANGLKVGGFF